MLMNKTEFWLMNNPVRRLSSRFETRHMRKLSPAGKLNKVLEIGCGEGQGSRNILKYFQTSEIHAIDLDPKMIGRAKKRQEDPRVIFSVGDAANLTQYKDSTFDAIFDFGIIHHIPNWREALSEMHRVLKPHGYIHIMDGSIESFTVTRIGRFFKRILEHPYEKMYTKAKFSEELSRLGFKTLSEGEIKYLHFFWLVARRQG